MTPKQKAEELVLKYLRIDNNTKEWFNKHIAKQCSLIAVDEMIVQNGELYLNSFGDKTINFYKEKNDYLFKVKQEIEKL